MMKFTNVVAAIIKKDNQYLIVQRNKNKHLGLKWEFPGGKVEPNESEEECLMRELAEELSIDVKVGDLVAESHYTYEHGEFLLKAYEVRIVKGKPVLTVHDQMVWVEPAQLREYRLAPADVPIAIGLFNTPR